MYVMEKGMPNKRSITMARDDKGFMEGHDKSIGKGEFANLPQDVKMKEYPKFRMGKARDIDDSMTDIDYIQGDSESKRDRFWSDQK